MKDNKYVCSCCGGKVNRISLTCEYCGTQYKEQNDTILKIETFRNPVRTFTATAAIDYGYAVHIGAEKTSELAMKQLVHELSKCIAPMIEIESRNDPRFGFREVSGTIKIVQPVNTGGKLEW